MAINSSFPSGTVDAVRYTAQTLSEAQQTQARANVGAQSAITAAGMLKGSGTAVSAAVAGTDYAMPSVGRTATLTVAGWIDKQQTVAVAGVTETNNIIVSAAPASFVDWGKALVRAVMQGAGTVTFECNTVPKAELTANIVIEG